MQAFPFCLCTCTKELYPLSKKDHQDSIDNSFSHSKHGLQFFKKYIQYIWLERIKTFMTKYQQG